MATSHAALEGSTDDLRKVTRALLSVSDKTDLEPLGKYLASIGVEILSTGGTAARLRAAGVEVVDVSTHTGSPEMLDGRVKSLHPLIHGGILAVRGNAKHEADMKANGIKPIDMVVLNLYPFEATVAKGGDFATCTENIDIGGPAMLRASAKNHAAVTVVTSPSQYGELMACLQANDGCTSNALRVGFSAAAFAASAKYDAAIAEYFAAQAGHEPLVSRAYRQQMQLKYGCNPHQKPAGLSRLVSGAASSVPFPLKVVNGRPGYINLLDAMNAWQLVKELRSALNLPAAASFKHVSPAGAGVAVALTPEEVSFFFVCMCFRRGWLAL